MKRFKDVHNRLIRLTDERQKYIEAKHTEMSGQIDKIFETLLNPDIVIKSRSDPLVELFYRYYKVTSVTEKYLCVAVKVLIDDLFIITAYLTNTVKKGEILWERR